jgi:hypothetical protein
MLYQTDPQGLGEINGEKEIGNKKGEDTPAPTTAQNTGNAGRGIDLFA